ncbi:MAG TPA: transporter substrate-binding domain-containing protein [Stellaceae bacterium]|nr:transporter substrate-binding domain-containing protein [Stellaceae bacterium]
MRVDRRKFLAGAAAGAATVTGVPHLWIRDMDQVWAQDAKEIKVGVLYSLTGTTAIIEKSMSQVTQLAIDQLNKKGGVLGRKVVPVIEDPASDPKTFSEKANKLVVGDKVPTVFGSYTSASRKAVLPVFEKRNNLYWYPTYYEGFECSKNVIYTGAVPNQQQENFVPWIIKNLGKKKFFIVGSNYIYPREMAKVCKILVEKNGGQWIADEYLELGHSEWGAMVKKIKDSGCDVVYSNVVGDSVVAFYREYKNQGLDMRKLPICATVTSEIEVQAMGPEFAVDSYTSFPYFQSVNNAANHKFVEDYKSFAGKDAVTHHALECAYFQVFLWAQAVEKAGKIEPEAIREGAKGQEFDAPEGHVKIEAENLHTWLTPRIGQVQSDGQFKIVDEYKAPIRPLPYSAYGETNDNLFCTAKGLDASKLKKT